MYLHPRDKDGRVVTTPKATRNMTPDTADGLLAAMGSRFGIPREKLDALRKQARGEK